MDDATKQQVLAHTQAVARQFLNWRGNLESLITFVRYSMKTEDPSAAEVDNFLRRESTQRELAANWEVGLWRATDKTFRFVSLAIPTDPEVARRRLEQFPASTNQCSWCQIDERSFAPIELKPELDVYRNPVSRRMLHQNCQRPWQALRALAERETK